MILMTDSSFLHRTKARRFVTAICFLLLAAVPKLIYADQIYTFSTIPMSGNLSGTPGSTIGWGYSIANQSRTDWLLATNLSADSFAYGTPTLLFDFPEVAPGATVMQLFDPVDSTGLYQIALNAGASNGSVDSGNFILSAQWFNGDPFNGGTFIADAVDARASYSVTVRSTSAVPEPCGSVMSAPVIAAIVGWWAIRRHRDARSLLRNPAA